MTSMHAERGSNYQTTTADVAAEDLKVKQGVRNIPGQSSTTVLVP